MANNLEKKQRTNMIARRLIQIRKEKRMSQHDLAAAADCTQGLISQYESGVSEPPLAGLIRMCDAMGCSVDYLIGRDVEYNTSLRSRLLRAFERLSVDNQNLFVVMVETAAQLV